MWDIVENGVPKSADPPASPQSSVSSTISVNRDADALAKTHQGVADHSIFPRIMNSTSAKQAWDTLQDQRVVEKLHH